VAFLPLILGLPLALATSFLYANVAGVDTRSQPHFNLAISMYAAAALMELLSEPMHNRAMGEVLTGIRVRAEGIGITSKTTMTCFILWYDSRRETRSGDLALLAFAAGQLAYGVSVFASYLSHFREVSWWSPRIASRKRFGVISEFYRSFDPQIMRLALTMTSQSLFKHVLTEGDKLILSWASPLQDQGGYAIAVNYGSLVARIVFQPIEEILRVYFSKTLSPPKDITETSITHKEDTVRTSLQQAANALVSLLAIQSSLAVILVTFGSAYISIVLHILLPPRYLYTSAPSVLEAWIWYIPVLAVNGGLEAFVSSVAMPKDLNRQSRWMAGFSTVYISTAIGLYALGFGDKSLVYANIINLLARIVYALHFTSSYFAFRHAGDLLRWKDMMPTPRLILASMLSSLVIHYYGRKRDIYGIVKAGGRTALLNRSVVTHVVLGCLLALICVTIWWMSSGRFLVPSRRAKTE
jgi:oligosaccharide translocation protein RFT1